jgi:acetyl-CoA acetyltransferase
MELEPVASLGACRTPIGGPGGSLRGLGAAELGSAVGREAIERGAVAPGGVGASAGSGRSGVGSPCIGRGMGIAMVLQRVHENAV